MFNYVISELTSLSLSLALLTEYAPVPDGCRTLVCCGIGRCGRGRLIHVGGIVLEDMDVATE